MRTLIALVVVLFGSSALFSGCSSNVTTTVTSAVTKTVTSPPSTVTITSSPSTIMVTTFPPTEPPVTGQVVIIIGGGYADPFAYVKAGVKFKWFNQDHETHTVSRYDNEVVGYFDYSLNPGASVEHGIEFPGTYEYHCLLHVNEVATLVVK
jgi:plastocyanin